MTAAQLNTINTQIWHDMSVIAEDEGLMRRAAKYLHKLVKETTHDPTLMTKDEFFQRVDEAKKGPTYRIQPEEDLTTFLRRLGHDV
ncbi:MAG: hypothetical protein IJV06_04060 [Bacteroidaceae bacterium]|nr:hypothetical protein [Bacteroidaceae bacterium]